MCSKPWAARWIDLAFEFETALIGGAVIDETGEPRPEATLKTCKASDAVLLAAIATVVAYPRGC